MRALFAAVIASVFGTRKEKQSVAMQKKTYERRSIEWLLAQDFVGYDFQQEDKPGTDYANTAVFRHEWRGGEFVPIIPAIKRGPIRSIERLDDHRIRIIPEWCAISNDGGKTWQLTGWEVRHDTVYADEDVTVEERSDGLVVLAWSYISNGRSRLSLSIRRKGRNIPKPGE